MKKTSALQYIMIYSALLLAVAWSIYPILRVITISIRPGDNLLNESLSIIPTDWTFDNYIKIFTDHPLGTWIWMRTTAPDRVGPTSAPTSTRAAAPPATKTDYSTHCFRLRSRQLTTGSGPSYKCPTIYAFSRSD